MSIKSIQNLIFKFNEILSQNSHEKIHNNPNENSLTKNEKEKNLSVKMNLTAEIHFIESYQKLKNLTQFSVLSFDNCAFNINQNSKALSCLVVAKDVKYNFFKGKNLISTTQLILCDEIEGSLAIQDEISKKNCVFRNLKVINPKLNGSKLLQNRFLFAHIIKLFPQILKY